MGQGCVQKAAEVWSIAIALLTCDLHRLFHAGRPLAEHYLHLLAPAFVYANQGPINSRRNVAEQCVGGGMDVQRWSNQYKLRLLGGKFAAGEISEALEFAAGVVPGHAGPVVHAL